MKFSPEYVRTVLNEIFEDQKTLFLDPLMAINYAHLVMLSEQNIVPRHEARVIREALDGLDLEAIRRVVYDGTYEDLFFYIEQRIIASAGMDSAGRLHTARSLVHLSQESSNFVQATRDVATAADQPMDFADFERPITIERSD